MPIELDVSNHSSATLRVIGVGGAGGNAVRTMITRGLEHVEFIVANTDNQALMKNPAPVKIKLGSATTRGLGAGAKPDVGRAAIEESIDEVRSALEGSDMVFVTAGMGGGTGTGAAPVVAQIARDLGALVVGIVTKPFSFENKARMAVAEAGIKELRENVDALIVIPNDRILNTVHNSVPFAQALEKADEVLLNATKGIADIIMTEGMINVDFADVDTVMRNQGDALMGIGTGSGERRAMEAAQNALNSPILEGLSIWGAKGLLVNITGGQSLTLHEVQEAVSCVQKAAGEEAHVIHGVVVKDDDDPEISVTVVATGFVKATESQLASSTTSDDANAARKPTSVISIAPTDGPKITVVTTTSEQVGRPSLQAPEKVDRNDINTPAIWRNEKVKEQQASQPREMPAMRITPSQSTSEHHSTATEENRIPAERTQEVRAHDIRAHAPIQSSEPPSDQPEAFPRTRVRANQAGTGSNQPSFLRRIMD